MKNEITTTYSRLEIFCPHCEVDFRGEEPVSEAGSVPDEGDVGVCANCGKWWEIKDGRRVKYSPTQEQMEELKAYLTKQAPQ